MRIEQLFTLDESELGMCMYIVNELFPIRPFPLNFKLLPCIRQEFFTKKIVDAAQYILPEYNSIYMSLLKKLEIESSQPTN